MTAKSDLGQAIQRLNTALSQLDDLSSAERERAKGIRVNLTRHIALICDDLDGKTAKCQFHPREKAHNCAVCRSEKLAAPQYRPNPISDIDARVVGERHD